MNEYYQDTVENYEDSFHLEMKKGPNSMNFIMHTAEGPCTSSIFDVLPHAHLIYYDIHAHSLPGGTGEMPASGHPVQINWCIEGKTELTLDDRTYIYMGANDICLSSQKSQGDTYFPLKYYRGIAIFLEDAFFSEENRAFTDQLLPDVNGLRQRYLRDRGTFLGTAGSRVRGILEKLWRLHTDPEIFCKRIHVLELLDTLIEEGGCNELSYACYTAAQVGIAKKTEKILTADLSSHIPVRLLADRFGVSETSLKNYFRGVYGKNISAYLHDLRMEKAETALETTDLPISEIAAQVGYTKQGKFAEVFKNAFGVTPLEWRRMRKLQKMHETESDSFHSEKNAERLLKAKAQIEEGFPVR